MPPRLPQKPGSKGSLKWVQTLVNQHPAILNTAIGDALGIEPASIEWRSPLAADDHAEYRDQGFLDALGINLPRHPLPAFWPDRGPQWDALARTSTGVILVEAKAHIREMTSTCAAGPASMARIQASFSMVKQAIGAPADADWTTPYYQYANRIAHLYLLRELNGIEADLVNLCFLNDHEMAGPTTAGQWQEAIQTVHAALGLPSGGLMKHVRHVFVDVGASSESTGRPCSHQGVARQSSTPSPPNHHPD